MPKVRANINVYSSTRFSGLIFEDDKTVPYDDDASLFRATERPIHAKTELKHTERRTQHCNNGRPTPVCDPYRPNRKIQPYSLVIHEGSPPQFPCRTWTGAPEDHLFSLLQLQYPHVRRLYSSRAAVLKKSSHRRGCGLPRCTSPKL